MLLTRGLISPNESMQLLEIGGGLVTFGGTVGWSLLQKHRAKKLLVVAVAQAGISEAQAAYQVASGAVPSVLTPPDVVPVVPDQNK